ncbi:MAG: hypothetical protein M3N29_08360 [Chloroflexota bacterium]|nr:hypothetical protein [Chloroflexota bacterium]
MQVDFYGYAGDCTISGRLDLTAGRLSEMLERADGIVVHGATLTGLHGEPERRLAQLTLGREDLFAVEATEPPPGGARRIHMVRHLIRLHCGPYTVLGELHALPGAPPLRGMLARRSVVPLTACTVTFARAGRLELRRAPVVIVNGWRIDRAEPASVDDFDAGRAASEA